MGKVIYELWSKPLLYCLELISKFRKGEIKIIEINETGGDNGN